MKLEEVEQNPRFDLSPRFHSCALYFLAVRLRHAYRKSNILTVQQCLNNFPFVRNVNEHAKWRKLFFQCCIFSCTSQHFRNITVKINQKTLSISQSLLFSESHIHFSYCTHAIYTTYNFSNITHVLLSLLQN